MYYHKEVLKQLMPIELSGVFLKDLELEGKQLDIALYNVEKLKEQIFPDTADIFLDYIRVYDIEVNQQDTIQTIREKIITKMNERGSLRKEYYINLAKKNGYTITIQELRPFMCGWDYAGCEILAYETIFIFRVYIHNQETYYFRAGESRAGERLLYFKENEEIEKIINDLKPAHTYVQYIYIGG